MRVKGAACQVAYRQDLLLVPDADGAFGFVLLLLVALLKERLGSKDGRLGVWMVTVVVALRSSEPAEQCQQLDLYQ